MIKTVLKHWKCYERISIYPSLSHIDIYCTISTLLSWRSLKPGGKRVKYSYKSSCEPNTSELNCIYSLQIKVACHSNLTSQLCSAYKQWVKFVLCDYIYIWSYFMRDQVVGQVPLGWMKPVMFGRSSSYQLATDITIYRCLQSNDAALHCLLSVIPTMFTFP